MMGGALILLLLSSVWCACVCVRACVIEKSSAHGRWADIIPSPMPSTPTRTPLEPSAGASARMWAGVRRGSSSDSGSRKPPALAPSRAEGGAGGGGAAATDLRRQRPALPTARERESWVARLAQNMVWPSE